MSRRGPRPISDVPTDRNYRSLAPPLPTEGQYNSGVQLFQHLKTGRVVVRKRFVRGSGSNPSHWYREMSVLRSLEHPNIVQYLDGYVTELKACLYMEVCDLGSAKDVAAWYDRHGDKIPSQFIWHLLKGALCAIVYCHTGVRYDPRQIHDDPKRHPEPMQWDAVFHRDLHWGNIFLKSGSHYYPDVKLGDFGASVGDEELDCRTGKLNHPATRLPFDSRGPRSCGEHGDVWSIGFLVRDMCHPGGHHPPPPWGGVDITVWPSEIDQMVRFCMDQPEPAPSALDAFDLMVNLDPMPYPPRPIAPQAFNRIR